MSGEKKKLSGAIRIFEALSGVEEELLAKCEQKERTKIISWRKMRYGGAFVAAACVCIVCFSLWQKGDYKYAATESAEEAAPAAGEEDAGMAEEAAPAEPEAGATSNGGVEELVQQMKDAQEEENETAVVESCMKDSRLQITETEAREIEVLGGYVPTVIPTGYEWESARANVHEETGECTDLNVTWTRGLDYISIYISKPSEQEMQESFDSPIFAEKDLTLEVIEARMKVIEDAGDTQTPRGNFSVYYDDGVLVRFSGRGTAQEIWELFQSMK